MSQYRETLHRWAAQHAPEDAHVVRVVITYDDGYEPTFTDRPESLSIGVAYTEGDRPEIFWTDAVLSSVGDLLTELFSIEETAA